MRSSIKMSFIPLCLIQRQSASTLHNELRVEPVLAALTTCVAMSADGVGGGSSEHALGVGKASKPGSGGGSGQSGYRSITKYARYDTPPRRSSVPNHITPAQHTPVFAPHCV